MFSFLHSLNIYLESRTLNYAIKAAFFTFCTWHIFSIALNGSSYWFDEIFSMCIVSEPIQKQVDIWWRIDAHPPLYYLLLTAWTRIFGASEIISRLLSCLFIFMAIFYFHYIYWKKALIQYLTGVLFLFTPFAIYYAAETRSYALLFMLSTFFFFRYFKVQKVDFLSLLLLFLIASCHFFGLIMVCSFFLSLFILDVSKGDYKELRINFLLAFLTTILPILYYVWLIAFGSITQYTGGKFWIKGGFSDAMMVILYSLIPFFSSISLLKASALIFTGYLFFSIFYARLPDSMRVTSLTILGSFLVLLIIQSHSPIFVPRYLVGFVPPFAGLMILGMKNSQSRNNISWLFIPLLLGLILAACINFRSYHVWKLENRASAREISRVYSSPAAHKVVGIHPIPQTVLFPDYVASAMYNYNRQRLGDYHEIQLKDLEAIKSTKEPIYVEIFFGGKEIIKSLFEEAGISKYNFIDVEGANEATFLTLVYPE